MGKEQSIAKVTS